MTELEKLRLKIALLKGWTLDKYNPDGWYTARDPQGRSGYTSESVSIALNTAKAPDWPCAIAQAWNLVEEMPHVRVVKWAEYWSCSVCPEDNYPDVPGDFYAQGDSAPEAISRCYLDWKAAQS